MPIIKKKAGTASRIQKSLQHAELGRKELMRLMKAHNISVTDFERSARMEFVRKADLVTSTLRSQGGTLNPTQETRFIRDLIESPTILNSCRVQPMPTDKYQIPKLGIGNQFFVRGIENTAVPIGDRTTPVASFIELDAEELIGQVNIPYESLEDNIEGDGFVDSVLALVGGQSAADLENLILYGDTTLGTSTQINRLLSAQDGIIKRTTSNVLAAGSAPMTHTLLAAIYKLMPNKYRSNRGALRFLVNPNNEVDLRMAYAARATGLGDLSVNGWDIMTPIGIPAREVPLLAAGTLFLTDPRNIIFGIRRKITLEVDRDIETRQFKFVVTCRVAVQIEEEKAVVKATGIA